MHKSGADRGQGVQKSRFLHANFVMGPSSAGFHGSRVYSFVAPPMVNDEHPLRRCKKVAAGTNMGQVERSSLLLDFAKIEIDFVKHLEVQRERFVSLLMIVGGIVLSSVGWDRAITQSDWLQGAFLVLVSILGYLQSVKLFTKMHMHYARYRSYRRAIDEMDASYKLVELKEIGQSEADLNNDYPWIARRRSHHLWAAFPLTLGLLGLGILLQAAVQISP